MKTSREILQGFLFKSRFLKKEIQHVENKSLLALRRKPSAMRRDPVGNDDRLF